MHWSVLTSLWQNGRRYHAFKEGIYAMVGKRPIYGREIMRPDKASQTMSKSNRASSSYVPKSLRTSLGRLIFLSITTSTDLNLTGISFARRCPETSPPFSTWEPGRGLGRLKLQSMSFRGDHDYCTHIGQYVSRGSSDR